MSGLVVTPPRPEPVPDGRPDPRGRCPRCGYDQRGVLEGWRSRCDLVTVCTECGFRIEWTELLSRVVRRPAWCVEYAPRWRSLPWRSATTLGTTVRPWTFWRTLRITHPPRWGRVAAYLLLLAAGLYGLLVTAHALVAYDEWREWTRMFKTYGGAVPPPPASGWRVALEAALLPLRDSTGPARWPSMWSSSDLFLRTWEGMLVLGAWLVAVFLLCPVGFAALPVSRTRAKVRWSHIVRVCAYSLPVIGASGAIWIVAVGLDAVLGGPRSSIASVIAVAAAVSAAGLLPFAVVWWSLATGRYLRIAHAWGVGLSVVLMAALTALLAVVVLSFV